MWGARISIVGLASIIATIEKSIYTARGLASRRAIEGLDSLRLLVSITYHYRGNGLRRSRPGGLVGASGAGALIDKGELRDEKLIVGEDNGER